MNKETFFIFACFVTLIGLILIFYSLIYNSNWFKDKLDREIEPAGEIKDSILYSRDLFYKEQEKSTRLYEFLISLLVAEWGATRLSGLRDDDKMGIMIQTPSGRFFAISRQHKLYADLPIDKSWTWELVLSKQGISTQDQIYQDLKLYANFAIQTKIAEERSFSTENPDT